MIDITPIAKSIINKYIDEYCGYRLKGEYGISAFWYWVYQIKNYILELPTYNSPLGENLIFNMKYWGSIIYNRVMVNNQICIIITNFRLNYNNFKKWINHQTISDEKYSIVGEAGYGYKIIQSTSNNKHTILTPQRKYLTKFVFDEIIGFHHFSDDYNTIYATGFQGDRVFAIYQDGNIKVLPYSKEEYLNKKHKYYESHKPHKKVITESHIRQMVREALRRYLQL